MSVLIVTVGVGFASATEPQTVEQVNVNSLIEKRVVSLGRLNGHAVYVTINDIVPDYVTGKQAAIVISHFAYDIDDEHHSSQGELGRRIEKELKTISIPDSVKLKRLSDKITNGKPGDVQEIALNIPAKHYPNFPVDRLYVVLFESGASKKKVNKEGLSRAMPNVIKRASNARMSDLIVPAVGYHFMDKNSIHFKDIFHPLFRSLLVSTTPQNVYVVLYEPWPTHLLEEAVKAINLEWKRIKSETQ